MNPPLPPDDLNPDKKSPQKSFESLLREHEKELKKVPQEMRIPAAPPTAEAAEETKTYIREKLGLPVTETPSARIFLGNEIVERASVLEGRIGEWEGLVCFVFLYRFGNTLRCIYMVPCDGVDARTLAKGVLWGYLADLPPRYVQSQIVESERFFKIKTFDLSKLGDAQVLEKYKTEYRAYANKEIFLARSERDQKESQIATLKAEVGKLEGANKELTGSRSAAFDDAFRWQMVAIVALGLIPVSVFVAHLFGV